jgi:predicted dinucleotide-binding enzyme
MKIGIIGTGNVGGALGKGWLRKGHEVIFGVRDPNSEKAQIFVQSAGQKLRIVKVNELSTLSEIIVLATPWSGTEDAIKTAGNLAGKILVDCTNPIAEGFKGLSIGLTTSAGEQVASWAKGARVVKAFNTTGAGNMANPLYGTQAATMFICGDDAEAKKAVAKLAEDLGFDPLDTGPLYHARYFEPMAMLWVDMAYVQQIGPNFAFKILRR